MYSDTGDTTSLAPGFPIRTSSDPRSVGSSPRHIAASHVLHRLSVPRHPPCALKHLQHKTKKMSHQPAHTQKNKRIRVSEKICITYQTRNPHKGSASRCSQPLSTNQTPHPTTKAGQQQTPRHPGNPGPQGRHQPLNRNRHRGLVVSKPNSVSGSQASQHPARTPTKVCSLSHQTRLHYREQAIFTNRSRSPNPHTLWAGLKSRGAP